VARSIPVTVALVAACFAPNACSNDPTGPPYEPVLPTQWAAAVDNTFFPLVPGTTLRYGGDTDEGLETIVVEVLSQTKVVNGVTATVVRDRVYLEGELTEDTFDWYAQDAAGNVWYLGEDSKEIENGKVVDTEGSWEWGVDGALPGIIMWANPVAHIGEEYRQEYYRGEAEDWGKVIAVAQSITVAFGDFSGCLLIQEWNALEPGTLEEKYYCPQFGFTLEVTLQGGGQRVELISRTGQSP